MLFKIVFKLQECHMTPPRRGSLAQEITSSIDSTFIKFLSFTFPENEIYRTSIKSLCYGCFSAFIVSFLTKPYVISKIIVLRTLNCSLESFLHIDLLVTFLQFAFTILYYKEISKASPQKGVSLSLLVGAVAQLILGLLLTFCVSWQA